MPEAAALREIIRDVISNTENLKEEGYVLLNAQEKFYNYIGIGSIGLDPAPKGMELSDEEIRGLWKRYSKEGKILIDDKDEQENIQKLESNSLDKKNRSFRSICNSLEWIKGKKLDSKEVDELNIVLDKMIERFSGEWGSIEIETFAYFLNNVIGIPFSKYNDAGRYGDLGVDVFSKEIIRQFWDNPHKISVVEAEKIFFPFVEADLSNVLKRSLTPTEIGRIRTVILPPLYEQYEKGEIKMVDIFHYAEQSAIQLLDEK